MHRVCRGYFQDFGQGSAACTQKVVGGGGGFSQFLPLSFKAAVTVVTMMMRRSTGRAYIGIVLVTMPTLVCMLELLWDQSTKAQQTFAAHGREENDERGTIRQFR